ncbi:hypothetical protein RJ639_040334 [Escallonia herrerae]|uniref:Pectinesterase n=1 Tax=Escallonia herrerae TaxID=1293975 RepID=A0AA88WGX8_9ASTE|nr:hypothetical protein RJ639_040334 [Escallonia herrerae]
MVFGKVIVSLVSLLLLVGVVFGVVAAVRSRGGSDNKNDSVSSSMKSVTAICQPTEFRDACIKSLGPIAKNASATPKDYMLAAIQTTTEELKKSLEVAAKHNVNRETDPINHDGLEGCKELLKYAVEDLESAISMVSGSQVKDINDRVRELLNWLTAVYAYQSQCLDGLDKPEYKTPIQDGMVNATQLTSNALTLISGFADIFKSLNISVPDLKDLKPSTSRKLLEVNEMGHDNYPIWFPAADRKLLAAQSAGRVRPNAVVAKDGSGQYKTIAAALAAYPKNHKGRFIIYVKVGIYDEYITVTKNQVDVFIYGDGAGKTIITGQKNFAIMKIGTMQTATFAAVGKGFIAKSMTFRNTAGPEGHQAVALRIQSDMSAIFDCSIEGYQDTLYYQTYRQFYRNCVISGTVDFIFGSGTALIQNSLIIVRRPGKDQKFTAITADGKEKSNGINGVVLQNCKIVADRELFPVRFQIETYLGRPWKPLATTVVMQSELADFIRPEGYLQWDKVNRHENTCTYQEFANRGPGARTNRRVRWKNFKVLSPQEAQKYTAGRFLDGHLWLKYTGAPFTLGL